MSVRDLDRSVASLGRPVARESRRPGAGGLRLLRRGNPVTPRVSQPSFPARVKVQHPHHRPAAMAGSSHSVSITQVRIGTTPGRRCTRRRPALSSHSVTLGAPVPRAPLKTNTGMSFLGRLNAGIG